MQLRDSRNTGRPVPFGLPKGADTDKLFASVAGAAADLLAQQSQLSRPAPRPTAPNAPRR